jgi:hypothetical protein
MTSPCKDCYFLSDDGGACSFVVMMGIPFTEPDDFEGELPDECEQLAYLREVVEEFEEEPDCNGALLDEFRHLVQVLENNREAMK